MELERRNRSCLPIVKRGCCFDLKTCCKFQGWLVVIGSTSTLLWSFWNLFILSDACNAFSKRVLQSNGPNVTCFGIGEEDDEEGQLILDIVRILARFSIVFAVIVAAAFLTTAALFLKGINKNEPARMVHFIRILWVKLIVICIIAVAVAVLITPVALVAFVYIGYVFYCLICANSLRIHMESKYVHFYSTENLIVPPTLSSVKIGY